MNVEVVQRRFWEQSQRHRKHRTTQWIAASCDRVLERSSNQDSLESRMLGNLHVRFGVISRTMLSDAAIRVVHRLGVVVLIVLLRIGHWFIDSLHRD